MTHEDPYLDEIRSAIRFLRERMRKTKVSYMDLNHILCDSSIEDSASENNALFELYGLFNPKELANYLRDAASSGYLSYNKETGWNGWNI